MTPKVVVQAVKEVYQGNPILSLGLHTIRLPNGVERTLEVIHHPGAAAVVPVDANGDVVLVHQLRYAAQGSMLYELPAGKLAPGEAPEACARRELEEETGLTAGRLEPLVAIWVTPGFCDERIHLFLARDLAPGTMALEEDEHLSVVRMPLAKALRMIDAGEITDAKTISGLAAAAIRLGALVPEGGLTRGGPSPR